MTLLYSLDGAVIMVHWYLPISMKLEVKNQPENNVKISF